ncbi:MAG: phage tail tape measure protein, partial [Candidatus Symbiothrix sp.]|nr:phage tail tape measure protein [Candidatus Symbiothrix sp.]
EEYKKKDKALKELNKSTIKAKQEAGLYALSLTDLRRMAKSLSAEYRNMVPGSAQQLKAAEDLKIVNARIRELEGNAQRAGLSLSKMANGFNKYFGMFTAGVAALSGFVFGIKNLISGNAKLSDSFADVMKTTGLTRKEVQGLYKDFKSLDTRTSRERLLELARDAGKLGIQGTDNIMRFVKAADQIDVALGEDMGEDAIKNIGKLIGVLENVPVKMGGVSRSLSEMKLDDQMLSVGSAINTLGQSSTANEGYIVEFTQRLSGVAAQAQIGVADVMGFASALDQSGQKIEMASTAMQNFITKIFEDPAKFAKIAGMEVGKFNKLLKEDTNQAIIAVLDSLSKKGGFQQLIPIFKDMGLDGSRAIGVLTALAKNVDKLREAQTISNKAFMEGTSVTNEFQTKNNNLAGDLEKLGKNIRGWFVNSGFVNWLSDVVSGLEKVTRAAKSANEQYEDQNKKVLNLKMNTEPLLDRYDKLAANANRSAEENAELKRIITEVTGVMPGAVSAVDEYGNAIAISTGRVREFIDAEVARLGVVNKKAIEENKKALTQTEKDILRSKKRIDEINATGTYIKSKGTVTDRKHGDTYEIIRKATKAEVVAEQEKYKQLLQDKTGYNAEIERLSGITLQKQIEQAEADSKAKEAQLAKEKEYFSKRKDELKKLMDAGDELAEKVYNQKYPKTPPPDPKETEKRVNERIKLIELEAAQQRIFAMQEYEDKESFEKKLLEIEQWAIKEKQALYKEDTDEYIRYQEELEKFTLKSTQDKQKAETDREEKIKALIEKYNKEAAVTDAQKKQRELDSLNELFEEELRNTEQYLQLKQAIEDKYRKKEVLESVDPILSDNKNFKKKEKTPQSFGDPNAEAEALKAAKEAELAIIDAAEASGLLSEIDFQEQRQIILDKYNALEIEKDKEKQQAKL